jgi:hypothetical protein
MVVFFLSDKVHVLYIQYQITVLRILSEERKIAFLDAF